jgi:DNA-binding LytR/AlgR family response regulator
MDIHLADGNSFEIFKRTEVKCPVIFTTAYDQYAIKAFKVNSVDYLLKPIKTEELESSLKKYQESYSATTQNVFDINQVMKLIQNKAQPELKRLIVKIGPKINAIKIIDVAYFQVVNKAVYAVLFMGNRYPIDYTMEQLETELNKEQFFRVNRSFIICFNAIETMTAYSKSRIKIELNPFCEQEVLSSTNRTGQFKSWLKGK